MKNENIFQKNFKPSREEVFVGIDEAGRGPVLGYLVYGALIIDKNANLKANNFRDSKVLSPVVREKKFETIKDNYSYAYKAIHPQILTQQMTSGTNLNQISFNTIIDIIHEIKKSYKVKKIFIDTVGCPKKMTELMLSHFPGISFIISTKADSKYPIVSGASIIAKVMRDSLLGLWKEVGSGYPGDPITQKWLKVNFNPVFGFSSIVRFTWSTIKEYFPQQSGIKLKGRFNGFYLRRQ